MNTLESTEDRRPRPTPKTMAAQYDKCIRTIERWVEAGILPEPDRINGRKSWPPGTEPRFDPPRAK